MALILGSAGMVYGLAPARAASGFALPAFKQQWEAGEAVTPNFWGPLPTAREGQQEAYREASGGQRTVQYFDKARMEMTNGTLTNGLLTVELKTGKMQTGDTSFESRQPARVNIAGDAGNDGPTYADLAQLPEKQPNADPAAYPYLYASGMFGKPKSEADFPFDIFRVPGGNASGADYASDPGGRYGNIVLPVFRQFVPNFIALCGLPISPIFFAQVKVAGKPTWVIVQAFERRVLTYNPSNPDPFKVEFGNIGQQYYQWRYTPATTATPSTASASLTIPPAATTTRAAQNGVTSPIRPGVAPASAETCPILYPIKGSTQGGVRRYDLPGSATYPGTKPEICFLAPNDAQVAGYVPVKE